MNDKYIDFCSYIQPILSSCMGFVRTEGYFTHIPGAILAMSADETVFVFIRIPVIYDIYVSGIIGRFLQLKTPEEQSDLFSNLYFTGWNIKDTTLQNYMNCYANIDRSTNIFEEPNCYNIPGFNVAVSSTNIGNIHVSNGKELFIVPASKAITNLNKSDSVKLDIFDSTVNNIKIVNYTMFKKKFKLNVEIFMNIIV